MVGKQIAEHMKKSAYNKKINRILIGDRFCVCNCVSSSQAKKILKWISLSFTADRRKNEIVVYNNIQDTNKGEEQ